VQRNNLFFSAFRARTLLARAGHRASRELVLMDPREGRDRIFEVVMLPLPSADGRSEDSLFVLRDVTDLGGANHELEILAARASAAEHEARREADRLSAILDDVAVPVLVTDRRTDVTLMTREAARLLTSGTADVVADGETGRIFRSNGLELAGFIQASLLAPRPRRQARLTLVDPGGSRLAVRAVSTRVPDRNDEGATLVTVLHDLTPRLENRKLAQKLRRLNVDLEERIAEATRELASRNTELV